MRKWNRRTVAGAVVLAIAAAVPAAPARASSGPSLRVDADEVARRRTIDVVLEGCQEHFQTAEVRLVLGVNGGRRSAQVVRDGGTGTVRLTVPDWAPNGPATVEATCLEPNLSGASDGADVAVFTFPPAPLEVVGRSRVRPAPTIEVDSPRADGRLRVRGRDCHEPVRVAVTQGTDRVFQGDRARYGTFVVQPDARGRWSIDEPLRYAVGAFSDPMAPGPVVVFAFCGDAAYEPERAKVSLKGPAPEVHLLDFAPGGLYLSQCVTGNTLVVAAEGTTPAGPTTRVTVVPGPGYGEVFTFVDVPPGASSVGYQAWCLGTAGPAFAYRPATWTAS